MDQIFNADETGLNYKMLPSKTSAAKADREAPGAKKSKERVTVLTCANVSGSFKLPLLVIGKSAKPRALKNYDFRSLPVVYKNQKSAWMDATTFQNWFFEEFVPRVRQFLKENGLPLKALLLVEKAPSHPAITSLRSEGIIAKFLPPNTTSLIQPIDQGVIKSFKRNYRKNLLQEILLNCDENDIHLMNCLKRITMKDVIFWAAHARDSVKLSCLRKSWCALLDITYEDDPTENVDPENENETLEKCFKKIPGCADVNAEDVVEWIVADDAELNMNDDEIVQSVLHDFNDKQSQPSEETEEPEEKISYESAYSAFDTVLRFLEKQPNVSSRELMVVRKWHSFVAKKKISEPKKKV